MSDDTIFNLVARAPADATCMFMQGRTVTYGALHDDALRIAQGLRARGLQRGDTVAVWLPNLPEWLVAALACARLGLNLLPLNMRYGTREVGDFLSRTDCRALFYLPHYRGVNYHEILCKVPSELIPGLRHTIAVGPRDGETTPAGVDRHAYADWLAGAPVETDQGQAADICVTFASSGTTSLPKLIQHIQRSACCHGEDVVRCFGLTPASRVLLAVPFGGAFGYTIAIAALCAAATLVVQEQFQPDEAAALLADQQVTHTFGTDDMLDKILSAVAPTTRFPALQVFGHANFTPALAATLPAKAEAHGVFLRGCYGMSEAMALFATQPASDTLERRAMSGGQAVCREAAIRVRSLETGELLGPGHNGEIEIFSPNLTRGYLADAPASAAAFREDGFLRTGDLGYMMPDGGVTLLSRIGDVLRIGGYLVNPLEIEETVLAVCDALACQVIALETANSVRPVAFVVGANGYAHQESMIIERCKSKLATYKVPIRVFALDEFPVTDSPNGKKVKKNVLKEMAMQLVAQNKDKV